MYNLIYMKKINKKLKLLFMIGFNMNSMENNKEYFMVCDNKLIFDNNDSLKFNEEQIKKFPETNKYLLFSEVSEIIFGNKIQETALIIPSILKYLNYEDLRKILYKEDRIV